MIRTLILLLTCLFLSVAAPIAAQETTGTITARFDGAEMQWFVIREGDNSQSNWHDMSVLYQASIWGQLEADKPATPNGALILGFMVINAKQPTPSAMSVTVQFLRDGYGGIFINADSAEPVVKLESVTIDGDQMRLKGSFEGILHLSKDRLKTLDMNDPKPISGHFDVTIDQQSL